MPARVRPTFVLLVLLACKPDGTTSASSEGSGELTGETTVTTTGTPTSSTTGVPGIEVGAAYGLPTGDHACAIDVERNVWCWGANYYANIGQGASGDDVPRPVRVPGLVTIVDLGSQDGSTCAVRGDGALLCWGYAMNEFVGDDGGGDYVTLPTQVPGVTGVVAVEGGSGFLCVRYGDGTMGCRGENDDGQLGDGTQTDRPTLAPVTGLSGVEDFDVGHDHVCAVTGGKLMCWGRNFSGQLGLPMDGGPYHVPTEVPGLAPVTRVGAGQFFTCAVHQDGTVSCWGRRASGNLGDGSDSAASNSPPVQVAGLTDAVSVSLGNYHACATTAGGELWCWGNNGAGQLGDGTQDTRPTPVKVDLADVVTVATDSESPWAFTCAVDAAAAMWCWGSNQDTRLGAGVDASFSAVPVRTFLAD